MQSYTSEQWSAPPRLPPLDDQRAEAVRLAGELRAVGAAIDTRRAFASALARRAARDRPWVGPLVAALLRSMQYRKRSGLPPRR